MKGLFESLRRTNIGKSILYFFVGVFSYPGLAIINKLRISGTEHLEGLPKKNVLFVSNHQTYFADVITMLHIFCTVKWGKQNRLGIPYYLFNPFTRVYFVAAEETMKKDLISRLFRTAGCITVKRAWRNEGNEVQKGLNPGNTRSITEALKNNWVITFPQGTTTPFVPGRKGAAFIIKQTKPIVIPVVIDGFSKAFDKKGLKLKKKGTLLSVKFKEPLQINYDDSLDVILSQVMDAIEQSKTFMPQEKQQVSVASSSN
ncbi:MAG TPA: lysophospholipid acyltransferase family protein [Chitinophagaceae bacterium]|nr:lysophospholipid acyltransferase family protein [Chitinophagaceae bacterium]